jgi:hypothetical protein
VSSPLITPQLNSNGTSADELIDNQLDILDSLRKLLPLMQRAVPHGRNFRTDEAFVHAERAWAERLQMVIDLKREIEGHAYAIKDAQDERQRPARP